MLPRRSKDDVAVAEKTKAGKGAKKSKQRSGGGDGGAAGDSKEVGRCKLNPVETHVERVWFQRFRRNYDKLPFKFCFQLTPLQRGND